MNLFRAARIFSKCENPGCGKKFEQDPVVILKGKKDRFCSDVCTAQGEPDLVCQACGAWNDRAKAAYSLPICFTCQGIAIWSCWRKRIFTSGYEAGQWIRVYQIPLTEYPCPLCERWHASSWSIFEVASDEYKARVAAIAAVFKAEKFDIDVARGYTNNPDGTHEIGEHDPAAGRAAMERLLKQGRRR